jgi:hypothetical protein
VLGAYHVHTSRSDGSGSPETVAAAAARAGLQFVILTDHGDATRAPDPPQYRAGVLVLDAVEISTRAGHLVALGLNGPAPYPLAGEAADVLEDIHRLGGWAVAAHPDSPKPDLRWRAWNVPFDGIEYLNVDSEWRDESPTHLAGTFLRYFVRPPETIATLFQRPVQTLRRWDMAGRSRPVAGLAALDAHARLPWRTSEDEAAERTLAALPGYRPMFGTLAQAAILDAPFSGEAGDDAERLLQALRQGRAYSVVTAVASPARLEFMATYDGGTAEMGESLGPVGANVLIHAEVNDDLARLSLLHNGAEIAAGRARLAFTGAIGSGAYRVEAYRPGVPVPWIISNPIYGDALPEPPMDSAIPEAIRFVDLPGPAGWAIERNETSSGSFTPEDDDTRFSFTLGPGAPFNQFAALVAGVDGALASEGFDRVRFTVRASQPVRFSVQLRLPGRGEAGQRWRHSVYADQTPRQVVLHLQDFQPADGPTSQRPIVARVRSVLFVVDTLNATPSTNGSLWLSDVGLGVGRTER